MLATGAWLVARRSISEPVSVAPSHEATLEDAHVAPLEEPVVSDSRPTLDATDPARRAPDARVDAVRDGATCTIELVVVDETGTERTPKQIDVLLVRWKTPGGRNERLQSDSGRFELGFAPGERWDLEDPCVDGRLARFDGHDGRNLDPASGSHRLRVRASPTTSVRVVDERRKTDCQNVEIRWAMETETETLQLPPPSAGSMIRAASSPIELLPSCTDAWRNAQTFWAGTAELGWQRLEMDLRAGGAHVLKLSPAGSVEFEITGLGARLTNTLRISTGLRDQDRLFVETSVENGRRVFDGLPAGFYRATIEAEGQWPEPVLVESEQFHVEPDEPSQVRLHCIDPTSIVIAPLAGTITIAPEWNVGWPTLSVHTPVSARSHIGLRKAIKDIEEDPRSPRTWTWDAGFVDVGWNVIDVSEPRFTAYVQVTARGEQDFAIVLGPPAEVTIEFVDDATGAPSVPRNLNWRRSVPEGVLGFGSQALRPEEPGGPLVLRVPPGRLVIGVDDLEYERAEFEIEAKAPKSVHTLRVKRTTVVVLELKSGGRRVAYDDPDFLDVVPVGHDGAKPVVVRFDNVVTLHFARGGRYRFTLADTQFFEPVAPFELDIVKGTTTHHPIQLVRKP